KTPLLSGAPSAHASGECPLGFTYIVALDSCFYLSYLTLRTWEEAFAACQSRSSELVSLETSGKAFAIEVWIRSLGETQASTDVWTTGWRNYLDFWWWMKTPTEFGKLISYFKWMEGQKAAAMFLFMYVFVPLILRTSASEFPTRNAGKEDPSLPSSFKCPAGYTYLESLDSCFYMSYLIKRTWDDAVYACNSRNSELVSLQDFQKTYAIETWINSLGETQSKTGKPHVFESEKPRARQGNLMARGTAFFCVRTFGDGQTGYVPENEATCVKLHHCNAEQTHDLGQPSEAPISKINIQCFSFEAQSSDITCDAPFQLVMKRSCYSFSNLASETRDDAEIFCKDLHPEGTLAELENVEELVALTLYLNVHYPRCKGWANQAGPWIGGLQHKRGTVFNWTLSNSSIECSNWGLSEPNTTSSRSGISLNCNDLYTWKSTTSDTILPFICEIPPKIESPTWTTEPPKQQGTCEKPVSSKNPEPSKKPRPTVKPDRPKKPKPSKKPSGPTMKPDRPKQPKPSKKPKSSKKPKPSKRPGISKKPEPSNKPEVEGRKKNRPPEPEKQKKRCVPWWRKKCRSERVVKIPKKHHQKERDPHKKKSIPNVLNNIWENIFNKRG
ncbi:unnamed protein product, partial [Cyprideis torosa]